MRADDAISELGNGCPLNIRNKKLLICSSAKHIVVFKHRCLTDKLYAQVGTFEGLLFFEDGARPYNISIWRIMNGPCVDVVAIDDAIVLVPQRVKSICVQCGNERTLSCCHAGLAKRTQRDDIVLTV